MERNKKDQFKDIENDQEKFLKELFEIYMPDKDNLVQLLDEIQDHYGYISLYSQEEISKLLKIKMAEIYGIVKFYPRFTLEPKGKYTISVCLGGTCYSKGAQRIMDRLTERLKIEPGQTTKDGLFTIKKGKCTRTCGLAPVFKVNEEIYGNATVQKLDEVLDRIIKENNTNRSK